MRSNKGIGDDLSGGQLHLIKLIAIGSRTGRILGIRKNRDGYDNRHPSQNLRSKNENKAHETSVKKCTRKYLPGPVQISFWFTYLEYSDSTQMIWSKKNTIVHAADVRTARLLMSGRSDLELSL